VLDAMQKKGEQLGEICSGKSERTQFSKEDYKPFRRTTSITTYVTYELEQ